MKYQILFAATTAAILIVALTAAYGQDPTSLLALGVGFLCGVIFNSSGTRMLQDFVQKAASEIVAQRGGAIAEWRNQVERRASDVASRFKTEEAA